MNTHSINTPQPVPARALLEAITAAAKQYGEAADKTSEAWSRLDEGIERGEPVKRLDRREHVAVLCAARQSQAWHELNNAKAALLKATAPTA